MHENYSYMLNVCKHFQQSIHVWAPSIQWCPTGVNVWSFVVCLYVNELPSLVSSSLLMFVDDIKLLFVVQWTVYSYNKMLIFMHIGNNATNCNYHYTLNGVDLELLEDIRDLRIQMDSKLLD